MNGLGHFCTGARQMFTAQKLFFSESLLTMETAKYPSNTFSSQITICQISFEIYLFFTSKVNVYEFREAFLGYIKLTVTVTKMPPFWYARNFKFL